MDAQKLNFFVNENLYVLVLEEKLVKWQKYHRYKLRSVEGGGPGTILSKYASAVNQGLHKNRAVTGNRTMPL